MAAPFDLPSVLLIEVIDQVVDVFIDLYHLVGKVGVLLVGVGENALVRVLAGDVGLRAGGITVNVLEPLPTHVVGAFQKAEGVVLIEITAIVLGFYQISRA